MATVYRARDRRLGREVAVKIIHRHLRENKEVGQRFASEARAVAKVKHPGVVEVYDVSEDDADERYLVVELIRGKTLRQLLLDEGHLPAEVAAAIGIDLSLALEHAHGLGVIHRDVKPENVLLRTSRDANSDPSERLVKITDFGIAKLLDAQGVTSTGQVLGSPAHMAPEQIEGGDVSARSDVFGLGVLLYECMVGKLPFDGKNPAQVLRRVLEGAFTPAERARPSLGAGLGAIVDRALAKDPKDRYDSALAVAEALRGELRQLGFDDPGAEVAGFLHDPQQYRADFEPRLIKSLVARGRKAREARDVPAATASFNRALAYRPNDAELVAEVSSLAQRERLRRVLIHGGVILAGSLVVAAVVGGVLELMAKSRSEERKRAVVAAPSVGSIASVARLAPRVSPPEPPAVPSARKQRRRVTPPPETKEEAPSTASVRVVVRGPANATVYVDGKPFDNWFGVAHDLPVGEHTFEFRPPNSECCVGSVFKTVNIRAPESPGQEQTVLGVIEWKPAVLEFRGAPLSTASCGEVATFSAPGTVAIPMQKARQTAHCNVIPPPQSGEAPKAFDVELSPGRTSSFPRP
jgi:eukaryotic-like serine/threonine-protein kinase